MQSVASVGTSGQVLTSQGAGALPAWTTISSGGGTVTSITAGTGLTGGTITASGTISLTVPVVVSSGRHWSYCHHTLFCHMRRYYLNRALQSVASVGTSGQVLTSQGAGALPAFY